MSLSILIDNVIITEQEPVEVLSSENEEDIEVKSTHGSKMFSLHF